MKYRPEWLKTNGNDNKILSGDGKDTWSIDALVLEVRYVEMEFEQ